MALSLVTAPTVEPVSLAEAKLHCRVTSDEETPLLETLITAARERAERATRLALLTQTWDLVLDAFPPELFVELPKPPLASVTWVKYRDGAGAWQTWASTNYSVEAPSGPYAARGRINLLLGGSWPSTYGEAGDVSIRFVCGVTAATALPALLKTAMLLDIATFFQQREQVFTGVAVAELPCGSREIYASFRSYGVQPSVVS